MENDFPLSNNILKQIQQDLGWKQQENIISHSTNSFLVIQIYSQPYF